jgi:peptidoglycan/xylan/chitin deacetylase (PgdA/CDA1 family)
MGADALRSSWVDIGRGYLDGWTSGGAKRKGIRVLCYHGVIERKTDARLQRNLHELGAFRAQAEYLRRQRVLSVSELSDRIAQGKFSDAPAAVITFDDGFANNLLAAEVLAENRLPWCLFATAGDLGETKTIWLVELSLLLLVGRLEVVEVLARTWSLRSRPEREEAFQAIRTELKAAPGPVVAREMDSIRRQFPAGETLRLLEEWPSLRMLTWNQVEQLSGSGVEIGSHGEHHALQHAGQPAEFRMRELTDSRRELETRLGKPCRWFAYPNGTSMESSPREVESAGYAMALTMTSGTLSAQDAVNPFLVPRLGAPGSLRGLVREFGWESP